MSKLTLYRDIYKKDPESKPYRVEERIIEREGKKIITTWTREEFETCGHDKHEWKWFKRMTDDVWR